MTPQSVSGGNSAAARDELEQLVGRAGAAINLQCRAAHSELKQTQTLLADATRELLDSFHAASDALNGLDAGETTTRVKQSLLRASQHLQFSDLVGQLLATTGQRVDGLLRVSQRLQELVQVLSEPRADVNVHDLQIAGEKRAFLEALAALESCGESRVKQRDTRAGGVDLF